MADDSSLGVGSLGPGAAAPPSLFEQAQQQWPRALGGVLYKETPRQGDAILEAWPPGEPGTEDRARPQDFPIDKYGIEVFDRERTRPADILADVTSHFLIENDPRIKDYYSTFVASMTPDQKARLHEQYEYAVKNEGEDRSEADWTRTSGLPAWFRGYAFGQWPKEFTDKAYTPEQRAMFDDMMKYLGQP
jgi:hypothetical protein